MTAAFTAVDQRSDAQRPSAEDSPMPTTSTADEAVYSGADLAAIADDLARRAFKAVMQRAGKDREVRLYVYGPRSVSFGRVPTGPVLMHAALVTPGLERPYQCAEDLRDALLQSTSPCQTCSLHRVLHVDGNPARSRACAAYVGRAQARTVAA
jgi:hypothetical protein